MAPMMDAMMPGPLVPEWYHPSARPMNPATSEPAIPSSIVMMTPPGSLPGMNSFARAPTTNPMMSDHKMCILPLPFTSKAAAEHVEDKRRGIFLVARPALLLYLRLERTEREQSSATREVDEGKRCAQAGGGAPRGLPCHGIPRPADGAVEPAFFRGAAKR